MSDLMATTTINIQIDSEILKQAQDVLSLLGLDITTAINLFLRQVICDQRIRFDIPVQLLMNETMQNLCKNQDKKHLTK